MLRRPQTPPLQQQQPQLLLQPQRPQTPPLTEYEVPLLYDENNHNLNPTPHTVEVRRIASQTVAARPTTPTVAARPTTPPTILAKPPNPPTLLGMPDQPTVIYDRGEFEKKLLVIRSKMDVLERKIKERLGAPLDKEEELAEIIEHNKLIKEHNKLMKETNALYISQIQALTLLRQKNMFKEKQEEYKKRYLDGDKTQKQFNTDPSKRLGTEYTTFNNKDYEKVKGSDTTRAGSVSSTIIKVKGKGTGDMEKIK